jgi:tetratricopeptide (TPR) repeat protein
MPIVSHLRILPLILLVGFASVPSHGQVVRAVSLLESIHSAEAQHLPEEQQGVLWSQLGVAYANATQFSQAENAYNRAISLLKTAPVAQATTREYMTALYLGHGRLDDAEASARQALALRRKVGDPVQIAASQIHYADVALFRKQFKQAQKLSAEGMQILLSSSDAPQTAVLSGFITLTYAHCWQKHLEEGLSNARQAVAFANRTFVPESSAVGFARETLGFAEWKTGATREGEQDMQAGIAILRKALAPADPRLVGAMLQYSDYLVEAHRSGEARELQQQVASMNRQAGVTCSGCTISANTLARGLR